MKSKHLLGLSRDQLEGVVRDLGEPPFRGRQLYRQLYRRRQFSLDDMTDLSLSLRQQLASDWVIGLPEIVDCRVSSDGTTKLLLELTDGRHIETVAIPEGRRRTLCISSQVGCDVGCTFCLTAQMGFVRNLRPGEIVGQVLVAQRERLLPEAGFNVVFMGMGEPLYNYANVMAAFGLLIDPEGMNLSHRRITISTSGVVPVLQRLAAAGPIPNLAISLNATTNAVRDRIMPINRKWDLEELLEACRRLPVDQRRRLTFEYVLLAGETDSADDAQRLLRLLAGIRAKVNLIPYNANPVLPHRRPADEAVERFRALLLDGGLDAYVRRSRGRDISAACGQLAHGLTVGGAAGG